MMKIEYQPPGPVAADFLLSNAFVRGIMGPIGSGKSVACCMDIMSRALEQEPGPDGVARTRAVIVRNSYPSLKSTTIKTWLDWFPERLFGKMRWDPPITHRCKLSRQHELETIFLALDRPDDIKKLLSLEATWVWLNEARELPKAILDAATGRVGRYPSARDGGAVHSGIIMDTNPPDDDHWWYKLAEEGVPEGFEFFRQPGGLDPGAENLNWLNQTAETLKLPLDHPERLAQGRQYYTRLVPGKSPEWVKVYVEGKYGQVIDGKPVHPEFNDRVHVSPVPLRPLKGLTLYLGVDFGLTPAFVIAQMTPRGQLIVLDEVVGFDMGLQQLVNTQLKPLLAMKYPDAKILTLHDPAGVQRSQADEVTCRQILKKAGLNPAAPGTNNFTARREALAWFLNRLVDGDPAIIIDPKCKWLRKGLNGDYKFKRMQIPGEERYKDVPDKTKSSHIVEALQYLTLYHYAPGLEKRQDRRFPHKRYSPALTAGY